MRRTLSTSGLIARHGLISRTVSVSETPSCLQLRRQGGQARNGTGSSTGRNTLQRARQSHLVQQQPSRLYSTSTPSKPDFEKLQHDLLTREIPITYDYLDPTPSHLLNVSLADIFAPPTSKSTRDAIPTTRPALALPFTNTTTPLTLPPAHHIIYFPPAIPAALLLPDGTDPLQSPGPPFNRRMWAGGSLRVNSARPLLLNGARAACIELIHDVTIKGREGEEKIFVGIERRVGLCLPDGREEDETSLRRRLGAISPGDTTSSSTTNIADGDDFGESGVIERRNIVFMRSAPAGSTGAPASPAKILAPPTSNPDFSHTFVPDERLLFRYSALTWNAHAIHLDSAFVRDVEGHRNLLVHGPLSFTLLVTALRRHLAMQRADGTGRGSGEEEEVVERVEYRNLAPLYAGENMRVCGHRTGEGKWEVWAETPEGGVAVRSVIRTGLAGGAKEARYGDMDMLGLRY